MNGYYLNSLLFSDLEIIIIIIIIILIIIIIIIIIIISDIYPGSATHSKWFSGRSCIRSNWNEITRSQY